MITPKLPNIDYFIEFGELFFQSLGTSALYSIHETISSVQDDYTWALNKEVVRRKILGQDQYVEASTSIKTHLNQIAVDVAVDFVAVAAATAAVAG